MTKPTKQQTAREWIEGKAFDADPFEYTLVYRYDALEYGEMCRNEGVGTCEISEYKVDDVTVEQLAFYHCESCHHEVFIFLMNEDGYTWSEKPNYCPSCGKKVVE